MGSLWIGKLFGGLWMVEGLQRQGDCCKGDEERYLRVRGFLSADLGEAVKRAEGIGSARVIAVSCLMTSLDVIPSLTSAHSVTEQ